MYRIVRRALIGLHPPSTRAAAAVAIALAIISGCEKDDSVGPRVTSTPLIYLTYLDGDTARVGAVKTDGTGFVQILDSGVLWSRPTSRLMTYHIWDDMQSIGGIYVSNLDGTESREIANYDSVGAGVIFPVLSPNGAKVAFFAYSNFIFVANADGGNRIQLTAEASNETVPAFSPDGTRIAFYGTNDSLIVIDSDGTDRTVISSNATHYSDGGDHLEWSPDGRRIVFTGDNDLQGSDICIIDADGTHETNLTNDAGEDAWPSFSPDGSRIIYSGFQGYDIWIMNADGSEKENLTNTPGEMEWRGTWSPRGDKVAYISLSSGGEGIGTLKVMNLHTKAVKNLFDNVWSEYFVEIVSTN